MPLTLAQGLEDALQDLPALVSIVNKVETNVKALPAAGRTAKNYSDLLVAILPDIAALVDQVEAQVKATKS